MKQLFLVLLTIIPLCIFSQKKGVNFEHNLNWTEIKAKAKAENKFIFMDCFTTWCGPCSYMRNTIFPSEEAGNFVNDKFISVAVQLDTTDNDNAEVKGWYRDGHDISQANDIKAYPTYLIFDAEGNIVHRFTGATASAGEFIEKIKKSLDPETQYYVLLKQYESGKKDTAFLHKMVIAAMEAYDKKNLREIVKDYLNTQQDLFTRENLIFLVTITENSNDFGFGIILNNPSKINEILGEGVAEDIVTQIILREEVFTKYENQEPDWNAVTTSVTKKYPAVADQVISKAKVIYYHQAHDWNHFQFAIADYIKKYGAKVSPNELNNYAWTVFQNCDDTKCLEEALEWSKNSFKDNNEPAFIDTYANILYKLGKKEDAISWEEKALNLAPGDKKDYEETLQKMKMGEKTWN